MSTKLELPDRVYVISKVYFSENACEIWRTTFRDFYVLSILLGPYTAGRVYVVYLHVVSIAHTIFRLLPEFRTCIREINFMLSLMTKEILVASECCG